MAVGSRWEQQAKHTQWFLRAWPHLGLLWSCSGTRDVENRIRFPVKDPDSLGLLPCVVPPCCCLPSLSSQRGWEALHLALDDPTHLHLDI